MSPQPSVGAIVHYTAPGSGDGVYPQTCRAAIVAQVNPGSVDLMVINPSGVHFREGVTEDPSGGETSYTWHWPERVPE